MRAGFLCDGGDCRTGEKHCIEISRDAVEWQIGRHYIVVTHIDTCLVGIGQEISLQEGRIMGQAPSSRTQCAEWEKGSTLIESSISRQAVAW